MRDIAERTGLPQPYLEQILLALKGAGLVRSKRGVGGGYVLARDPAEITLAQIVSAVDGPIVAGDFGEPHQNGACDHEGQCVLLAVWADVGEHMRKPARGPHPRRRGRHRPRRGPLARPRHRARPGSARAGPSTATRSAGSGGVEREALAGDRVVEAEALGVQERPRARQRLAGAAVAVVADHRVADGRQVHADLVGAAGLERQISTATSTGSVKVASHLVAGAGRLAPLRSPPSSWGARGDRPIGRVDQAARRSGWPHTSVR